LKSLIEIKSVGTGTVRISAPDIYAANTEGAMIDLQGLWKDIKSLSQSILIKDNFI